MQYASAEHRQVLAAAGVQMSKSRAGRLVAQDPPTPVDRVTCAKLPWVFAVIAVMLVLCLFADSQVVRASRWGGLAARTMEATFRDLATQWMVVLCCAIYFATFMLLERRATTKPFWNWGNSEVWVTTLLLLAALHYGLNYKSASGSTYALMLLGGVVLGKGAAFWAEWQNRIARFRATNAPFTPALSPLSQGTSSGFATFSPSDAEKEIEAERVSAEPARRIFIGMLVVLLAAAALLKSETGLQFQYRGQERWTGPWDNPNIFGMLMGVGCVLALGQLLSLIILKEKRHFTPALSMNLAPSPRPSPPVGERVSAGRVRGRFSESMREDAGRGVLSPNEAEREASTAGDERRTSSIEHRSIGWNVWLCLKAMFFMIAMVICGIGLIKSYSRGAWLGAAVGLGYLGWNWWRARTHLTPTLSPHPMGGEGESFSRRSCISRLLGFVRQNWLPASAIVMSVLVLAFWNFRHTEQRAARRAFSAANINDFSWRNRLAAWEGALQMMASKPLVGFGWNQPERIYDQFYRAPKVTESAAMQMNDYFTLGTTLGIPALVCFLAYVGLSLTRNTDRKDRTSPQPSPQRGEGENQAPARRETDSLPINRPLALVGTRSTASPSLRPEVCDARGTRPYRAQREIQGEVRVAGDNSGYCMSATGWKRCPTPEWLRAICRAGAIVLLVGFWFDGGLFKLATGSVFWILLELGRNEEVELFESESVKIPDAP